MRAVIFANGVMERWPVGLVISPAHDLIIAADGGLRHCRKWGFLPCVVVGDMDSVDPADLVALDGVQTEIIRHPARKDETDLELALELAVDRGADDIVVLAALGARWDMTLANVLLLGASFLQKISVRILEASQELVCLQGGRQIVLCGQPGDILSLLPLTGDAVGVTLRGLDYPLENALLPLGTSQGVSNVFTGKTAQVELQQGLLLITVTRQISDIGTR